MTPEREEALRDARVITAPKPPHGRGAPREWETVRLARALLALAADLDKWLAWSGGQYPDGSPGDVIAAEADGTIVLDDGITTWNPLRALAKFAADLEAAEALATDLHTSTRLALERAEAAERFGHDMATLVKAEKAGREAARQDTLKQMARAEAAEDREAGLSDALDEARRELELTRRELKKAQELAEQRAMFAHEQATRMGHLWTRVELLVEFYDAFQDVERGVVDFDLHSAMVERLKAADKAIAEFNARNRAV